MAETVDQLIDKQGDEDILFYVRSHVIPLFFRFTLAVLFLLLPFILMFWLFQYTFGVIAFFVLLVIAIFFMMRIIVKWYYTTSVVTTHRIVDVNQHGFFDRAVSEAPLDQVTDVFHRKKGILQHMFGYGTITIQTYNATLELKEVQHPNRVQTQLLKVVGEYAPEKKRSKKTYFPKAQEQLTEEELEECELQGIVHYLKDKVSKERLMEEFFDDEEQEVKPKKKVRKKLRS